VSSEEWKQLPGFEAYEVSSLGRIRRGNKIKKATLRKDGYYQVHLWKDNRQHTFRVNRLVCGMFHGRPLNKNSEALHKNHDRGDNRASNLRWGTSAENTADMLAAGRQPIGKNQYS
jgi:hypothetical protein